MVSTVPATLLPRDPDDPRTKFDRELQARFLDRFAETGRLMESSAYVGVARETVRVWRKTDPDFGAAYQDALEAYREKLRREIERRGVEGWLEPVYQGGVRALEPVLNADGTVRRDADGNIVQRPAEVRKFSDRLLELLAKRMDPDFRERVDLSGKLEGSTEGSTGSSAQVRRELERLSPEGRARLRAVVEELAGSTAREIPARVEGSTGGATGSAGSTGSALESSSGAVGSTPPEGEGSAA